MDNQDGRALLSGAYERRRGYLSAIIDNWNRVTLMGIIAIWTFLMKDSCSSELTPLHTVLAGGLSSILIGVWRCYARLLDCSIVKLYLPLYLAELACKVPAPARTISSPKLKSTDTPDKEYVGYYKLRYVRFGQRTHAWYDTVGLCIICWFAWLYWVITECSSLPDRPYYLMHVMGLAFIVAGLRLPYRKEVYWPISTSTPEESQQVPLC